MATYDVLAIQEFFEFVDTDKDGFITVAEIREACAVDIDGDGTLTEDEKDRCASVWINAIFPIQDLDGDTKLSLAELQAYAGVRDSA
jgi:Ca2+-binding EF-hand superfamily protein